MTDYAVGSGSFMPGPYGTNKGDIWLGTDNPVGKMLMDNDGLTLIHEMMVKDGQLQECLYCTKVPELIERATEGHKRWVAAQAERN